jgi:mannose-6-phosphate isomerase-like protein (cupin superfamily)
MQSAPPQLKPFIVAPNEGPTYTAFGGTVQFKLTGANTNGVLNLGMGVTAPGTGPLRHVHHEDDEIFIIVEGEEEMWIDEKWVKVSPGSVVFLPKNVPHTFRNVGPTPSKHWVITVPTGFDEFFRKFAEQFGAGPDFAKIAAICQEHHVEILERPPQPTS